MMDITLGPMFLALPTLLILSPYLLTENHAQLAIIFESLLLAAIAMSMGSILQRFFAAYDKEVAPFIDGESNSNIFQLFLTSVQTFMFLVLPFSMIFLSNTLLGPLRTIPLFSVLCLIVESELSIEKSESKVSTIIKLQKYIVVVMFYLVDLANFFIKGKSDSVIQYTSGYLCFTMAIFALSGSTGILNFKRITHQIPQPHIILPQTLIIFLGFILFSFSICNIRNIIACIGALFVLTFTQLDIETLGENKASIFTLLVPSRFKNNYKSNYLILNAVVIVLYFLNVSFETNEAFFNCAQSLLTDYAPQFISNLVVIFLIHFEFEDFDSARRPSVSDSEQSMTFVNLIVYLFHAEESKSIFNFLLLNIAFMFIQFLYSFRSKSLSLLSDSLHMLLDCTSLFLGLMASVIAKKNKEVSSKHFPFGLARIETLSGFTNGSLLLGIVFGIYNEAIQRIFNPIALENTTELLIVSFLGLLVNLVGIFAFDHGHGHEGHHHGHSHSHFNIFGGSKSTHEHAHTHSSFTDGSDLCKAQEKQDNINTQSHVDIHGENYNHKDNHNHGHTHIHNKEIDANSDNDMPAENNTHTHSHNKNQENSLQYHGCYEEQNDDIKELNDNMHGIFLHILADTLGSVGVILSTILVKYTQWKIVDPITSILIATLIFASALPLLKSSSSNLLLSTNSKSEKDLKFILEEILKTSGVKSYTTPRFWPDNGSSSKLVGYLHIQFYRTENSLALRKKIDALFQNSKSISSFYIQMENEMDDCWCRKEGIFGTG